MYGYGTIKKIRKKDEYFPIIKKLSKITIKNNSFIVILYPYTSKLYKNIWVKDQFTFSKLIIDIDRIFSLGMRLKFGPVGIHRKVESE